MLFGNGGDDIVSEKEWGVHSSLPLQFTEGQGTKRGISNHSNTLSICEIDKVLLDEVGVELYVRCNVSDREMMRMQEA